MATPSANPTFKLSYFNIKGLGEPIRFLFAYGGQNYEDNRVSHEDWPAIKSSTPMGQMPVLEVDGNVVHQSGAILRYLARRFGLAGGSDWESLLIDTVADTITDFRLKLSAPFYETDEAAKAKKKANIEAEIVPFFLGKLEEIAKENNGHLALSKLTWADLYFASLHDMLEYMIKKNFLEKYPYLRKVVDNVYAIDSIKSWIAKRPVSEY
ncbi:hypothetical protein HA402_005740 [Bradysia odoriphaga]|nr:hypothetical protein HA402_005740 [Bradysia odoriphaga]